MRYLHNDVTDILTQRYMVRVTSELLCRALCCCKSWVRDPLCCPLRVSSGCGRTIANGSDSLMFHMFRGLNLSVLSRRWWWLIRVGHYQGKLFRSGLGFSGAFWHD